MKIDILGVKVDKIRQEEVIRRVEKWLLEKESQHYIVTPNPEMVVAAQQDKKFKNILNKADIAIPDGIGLLWAAKFLSLEIRYQTLVRNLRIFWQFIYTQLSLIFHPKYCRTVLPERVTGTDLVWKIAQLCEQKNCSIYLLGAIGNISQLASKKLKQRFPNLKIAGAFAGSPKPEADEKSRAIINHAQPDILFVAYGHQKQEKWIDRNLPKLNSVKLAIGVGGAFDFIAEKTKRAPQFFRKLGLEWFWRLITQPWRIKRIWTATFIFPWKVLKYKINKSKYD